MDEIHIDFAMCWFVEFSVDMSKGKTEDVENIERMISEFKVKVGKKGISKVQLTRGSVADGYRTAGHCDCDFVSKEKKDGGQGNSLLHYPELFQQVIDQPGVKKISVHWYWSDDEPKQKLEKLTISEFLKRNGSSELSSSIDYKILKEKYY